MASKFGVLNSLTFYVKNANFNVKNSEKKISTNNSRKTSKLKEKFENSALLGFLDAGKAFKKA